MPFKKRVAVKYGEKRAFKEPLIHESNSSWLKEMEGKRKNNIMDQK